MEAAVLDIAVEAVVLEVQVIDQGHAIISSKGCQLDPE